MATRGLTTIAGDQLLDLRVERLGRTDAIDETPALWLRRASMNSPVTSISNAGLRKHIARQRHARRRAEQPEVDAAHGEARLARGHGQIALRRPAGSRPRSRCPARARSPARGRRCSVSIMRRALREKPSVVVLRTAAARISRRSWPAQKALPAPAITTTRAVSSAARRRARAAARQAFALRERVERLRPVERQRHDAARVARCAPGARVPGASTSSSCVYSIALAERARSRSTNFWILPVEVFGISSKRTSRGTL